MSAKAIWLAATNPKLTRVADGHIQFTVIPQIAGLAGAGVAIVTVTAKSAILTWI